MLVPSSISKVSQGVLLLAFHVSFCISIARPSRRLRLDSGDLSVMRFSPVGYNKVF
ncbi:hypothetical protein SynBIOSE41_03045 [Synechococcus sp. BIOS-E4-1]|nr:hypothetical protein SynBIOSE41_03045 [Synechococcus sp. BIOS-E4-1]